jgi:hypothetical protein
MMTLTTLRRSATAIITVTTIAASPHRFPQARSVAIPLDARTKLELTNTRALPMKYRGRVALHLAPLAGHEHDTDQEMVAVLSESDFGDGRIDVDVVGARRAGYATDNVSAFKGFVGISFRVHGDSAERFYIRPENARLDDQLFRNRSTQYEADPGFPWNRLRQDAPGVYESYVDLEPGAWTPIRIEVHGGTAQLFVNRSAQPVLIVNDMKNPPASGRIALWIDAGTDAHFSRLRVTPATGRPER